MTLFKSRSISSYYSLIEEHTVGGCLISDRSTIMFYSYFSKLLDCI
ncbi:hypothetical protein BVRB_4g096040 [Beta vulgaris subsp. vulgaris]|nr:hypothetical protein BVRB_4g096040 [Beta vulgaris subsp. vulgaris]